MSDELFEVAFSGQINAGAILSEVKAKVAKMFNADEAKLSLLFSGKRIVIKKNIDQPTAAKYRTALERAGAECEIRPLSTDDEIVATPKEQPQATMPSDEPPATASPAAAPAQVTYTTSGDYAEVSPPQLDPLGITADQIESLPATVAPVGSDLQDEIKQVAVPEIDLSGIEVAPVGSDIGQAKNQPDPPPPDTTGLSMVD